jgi:hypothetical protein
MRSIDPCPKCGGEKPHKGRSPTAVFRSPSRRRRRSIYRVLSDALPLLSLIAVLFFHLEYFIIPIILLRRQALHCFIYIFLIFHF